MSQTPFNNAPDLENISNQIFLAGVDEAGRGPLAGPVTAACVVFPPGYTNPQIMDSKKLTHTKREKLYEEIIQVAVSYAVVSVGARRIDLINIREATKQAMYLSIKKVYQDLLTRFPPSSISTSLSAPASYLHVVIDGDMKAGNFSGFPTITQETVVKGDSLVEVVSAASILAKVTRDSLMTKLENTYQGYEFSVHKGYGTKVHREKIRELGPCPIHRATFAGVKEYTGREYTVKEYTSRELPN
jgi:ribonuclease HII